MITVRRSRRLSGRTLWRLFAWVVGLVLGVAQPAVTVGQSIRSGGATLSFPQEPGQQRGLSLASAQSRAAPAGTAQPVEVLVCGACSDAQPDQQTVASGYQRVVARLDGSIVATTTIASSRGSRFNVEDSYAAGAKPGTFRLTRRITVAAAGAGDRGFNSRLAIRFTTPHSQEDYSFLVPAIWYDHDQDAGAASFAAQPALPSRYWRETRMPLPFVMMRNPGGAAVSIEHAAL